MSDLIVLQGGPRHGWWYTAEDWQTRVESVAHAVRMQQNVIDDVSRYTPTSAVSEHPNPTKYPGALGQVWEWRA